MRRALEASGLEDTTAGQSAAVRRALGRTSAQQNYEEGFINRHRQWMSSSPDRARIPPNYLREKNRYSRALRKDGPQLGACAYRAAGVSRRASLPAEFITQICAPAASVSISPCV